MHSIDIHFFILNSHKRFLDIYRQLLAPGGEIHQKTDNMHFFEFSIQEFSENGFALKNISLARPLILVDEEALGADDDAQD